MNTRIVTLITQLICALAVAGSCYAQQASKPAVDVGPGKVAWFDLTTPNLSASKEFYGKLFGWTFKAMAETDLAVDIEVGDQKIGTLRKAEGKLSPYDGVVYIQVDDLKASCLRAKELGASIPEGFPFNLSGGRGAIAIATDLIGHPFGLYSKTALPQ